MTNFTGPIEVAATDLQLALERAAEMLESTPLSAVPKSIGADEIDQASMDARELASEIGSKSGGDERLDRVLSVLARIEEG